VVHCEEKHVTSTFGTPFIDTCLKLPNQSTGRRSPESLAQEP
jgi:hypothetical protein